MSSSISSSVSCVWGEGLGGSSSRLNEASDLYGVSGTSRDRVSFSGRSGSCSFEKSFSFTRDSIPKPILWVNSSDGRRIKARSLGSMIGVGLLLCPMDFLLLSV